MAGQETALGKPEAVPRESAANPMSWNLALARANFVLGVAHTPPHPSHVILLHLLGMESWPRLPSARECCAEPSRPGLVTWLGTLGWQGRGGAADGLAGAGNDLPCSQGSSRLCMD